jgi:hypothetical protein
MCVCVLCCAQLCTHASLSLDLCGLPSHSTPTISVPPVIAASMQHMMIDRRERNTRRKLQNKLTQVGVRIVLCIYLLKSTHHLQHWRPVKTTTMHKKELQF